MSCGPGNAIIATNKSMNDKTIQFSFPKETTLPNVNDSLNGWDLTDAANYVSVRDKYGNSEKIPFSIDTTTRTIEFTLKAGHEVTVSRWATSISTIKKTIVTIGADTLKYKRKLSCWIYTIR